MGVSSSALKVEEKTPIFYNGATVLDKNENGQETFRLYRVPQSDLYEAVLYNPEERTVCLSVFRIEDERKAKDMFRYDKNSLKCVNFEIKTCFVCDFTCEILSGWVVMVCTVYH